MSNSIAGSGASSSNIWQYPGSPFKGGTLTKREGVDLTKEPPEKYTEFTAKLKTDINGKEGTIEIAFRGKPGEWEPGNIKKYIDHFFGEERLKEIFKTFEQDQIIVNRPDRPRIINITKGSTSTITHERPHAFRGPADDDIKIVYREVQPKKSDDDIKIVHREVQPKKSDDDIKIVHGERGVPVEERPISDDKRKERIKQLEFELHSSVSAWLNPRQRREKEAELRALREQGP
jgi:hypothetical protein